jgi:hypothetical protein
MREEIGAPSHQLSGTEFYFSVLLERLTKIETNCKGPGYDSTNCLKEIGAFANKKCLQFSVRKTFIIATLL